MIDKSRGVNGWELEVIRLALPIDANGILAMVNFLAGPQHPSQTSTDNTESLRKKSKMRCLFEDDVALRGRKLSGKRIIQV